MMCERDWEKIKIRNWTKMVVDREAWNRILEKTKPHKEL